MQTKEEHAQYIAKMETYVMDWIDNHSPDAGDRRLKVFDLVANEFSVWPPHKVDFRRHLKAGINLDKKIVMLPNGRPDHALYSYEGQLIARIRFEFEVDSFNFMTKRTEWLSYVRKSGEFGHEYPIWSQVYDKMDPGQQAERIKERVEARTHVFTIMKAKIETFLVLHFMGELGATYEEVLEVGGAFSLAYAPLISAWKDTGTPALKRAIGEDSVFEWLDLELPPTITGLEEPVSIRQYIIDSLSY